MTFDTAETLPITTSVVLVILTNEYDGRQLHVVNSRIHRGLRTMI